MNEAAILRHARELYGHGITAVTKNEDSDWYRFHIGADAVLHVEAGNARGVLYAVYDALAGHRCGQETPEFSVRGLNPCESLARHTPAQLMTLLDRMGRWRMNTLIIHSNYGYLPFRELIDRETSRRGITILHYTYSNLCFMRSLSPEHFAKDIQGNPKWQTLQCETRLCPNHPEALRRYREGVQTSLEQHPDFENMIFTTADGCDLCECPACRHLSPIEQWQSIFDPFFDAASPSRHLEMLSYVQRYSVPADLSRIHRLQGVLFDSNPRYPRTALGEPHEWMKEGLRHCYPPDSDPLRDPRGDQPINVYLGDRLKEWREAFGGQITVFENLMVQGIWGCPRPNTSIYLRDLQNFRKAGINGVIYEAFEPGISPFLPTFDAIAKALWNGTLRYEPTPFEAAYLAEGQSDGDFFAHFPGHEKWTGCRAGYSREELAVLLSRFHRKPSASLCHDILGSVLDHPDKEDFDWIYIAHAALKKAFSLGALHPKNPSEEHFLKLKKLWDFQELFPNPRETTAEVVHSLWRQMT